MTGSPSPSDRPRTAKSRAFALFRPVLFAIGAIGLALGGLVLTHRSNPEIAGLPTPDPASPAPAGTPIPGPETAAKGGNGPAAPVVLADSEPPPPLNPSDFRPADLRSGDFTGFQAKPADPAADPEPPASDRYELTLRLERGDTIDKILADIDVPEADRKQITQKLNGLLRKKKLAAGETIELLVQTMPDQPDAPRVLSLSVRPQPEREYIIMRQNDGTYDGEEKTYKVSPRIVRVEGERRGSLEQSGVKLGAPSAAMSDFLRALSYDVDFQRELKEGMKFTVLLEQLVTSDGRVTHPGRLLAGELRLLKRTVTVIRFRPQGGADGFYGPNGESVVRAFLRTPMDASRISSRFGMREHPILGYSALHAGVDFAAPSGTPILAAGAGRVVMAGPQCRLRQLREAAAHQRRRHRLCPHVAHRPPASSRAPWCARARSSASWARPACRPARISITSSIAAADRSIRWRRSSPCGATVGGKDAARFQALARQYVAQLKNAPVVAEVKPKAKETAGPQVAKGD
ncbi:MAG: hypothetical protein WDN31_00815 [Hyphomicrobium sp.]